MTTRMGLHGVVAWNLKKRVCLFYIIWLRVVKPNVVLRAVIVKPWDNLEPARI